MFTSWKHDVYRPITHPCNHKSFKSRITQNSSIRWVIRIPCARVKWNRWFYIFFTMDRNTKVDKNCNFSKWTFKRAYWILSNHPIKELWGLPKYVSLVGHRVYRIDRTCQNWSKDSKGGYTDLNREIQIPKFEFRGSQIIMLFQIPAIPAQGGPWLVPQS